MSKNEGKIASGKHGDAAACGPSSGAGCSAFMLIENNNPLSANLSAPLISSLRAVVRHCKHQRRKAATDKNGVAEWMWGERETQILKAIGTVEDISVQNPGDETRRK
jgi:hypothetical protein